MQKERLYTFLDDNWDIIEEVRAINHEVAIAKSVDPRIEWMTDFYSDPIEDDPIE